MNFLTVTLSAVILVASVQTTLGQQCKIGLSVPSSTKHKHSRKSTHSVAFDLPTSCDGGSSISLDLSDGSTKTFNRKQSGSGSGNANADARISSPSYESWMGEGDDGSSMNLIKANGNVFASVVDVTAKTVTQINIDYNGEQVAVTTPVSDFPAEGEPVDPKNARKLVAKIQKEKNQKILGDYSSHVKNSDTPVIDVMVVWTTKAECAAANAGVGCDPNTFSTENMRELINLAIFETNVAYYESGVDLELYNLYMYLDSTYVESSYDTFETALNDLKDRHKQNRISIGADMAVMIIDDAAYCGMAWMGPGIDDMYSVTAWGCATGYYSFGHELGHNMGLQHDRGSMHDCSSQYSNFGHNDPSAKFRTTLGNNCAAGLCDNNAGGGCPRIQRYSNPALTYTIGDYTAALGVEGQSNNAQQLNTVGYTVSQYYSSEVLTSPSMEPLSMEPATMPSSEMGACNSFEAYKKRNKGYYPPYTIVTYFGMIYESSGWARMKKAPTDNYMYWTYVGTCTIVDICHGASKWKKWRKFNAGDVFTDKEGVGLYQAITNGKGYKTMPWGNEGETYFQYVGECAAVH